MKLFGLKAFLRAITIFASIYLVKVGIELIIKTEDTFLKIMYAMFIVVTILFMIIASGIIFPTKHKNPGKNRKAEK